MGLTVGEAYDGTISSIKIQRHSNFDEWCFTEKVKMELSKVLRPS